mgnify:CR=1 FL=1
MSYTSLMIFDPNTAQLLGNYGEFFGAIAVLITLVYLSLQVRQNNIANKVASNQAINKKTSDYLKVLYQNDSALDVWTRGRESFHQLEKRDKLRFELMMYDGFGNFHEHWHQAQAGVTDEIQFVRVRTLIELYFSQPGIVQAWRHISKHYGFDEKFNLFIEEQIVKGGTGE